MTLLNRDISWLGFNFRVLQEAANKKVPLFERLKFLSIFSSNLNEFFRVRYPEILAVSLLKKKTKLALDISEDILTIVQTEIERQWVIFDNILLKKIIPELKKNGIIFYFNQPIRKEHLPEIKEIFLSKVFPFIQPIYLDGSTAKFSPKNNHLYLVVTLHEKGENDSKQVILNIPSQKLKRFLTLSPLDNFDYVIFLDDIIRQNLVYLFPRQNITGVYSIKINRDSELHLADEFSGNLLQKIEKQLSKRDFGPPSRFLFEESMPESLQKFLASCFGVYPDEIFMGSRYQHLDDLENFPDFGKNLFFKKLKPLSAIGQMDTGDIFKIMNEKDILIHTPYQSYDPVISFFNQAALDPDVLKIYITLYRVAEESHIINALISAAKNGKNVVAFVELKARFDEENNIKWSKMMKQAGVKIIYSIPGIKVHSKIAWVQKKKGNSKVSFAVISTGNFNEVTARFYADHLLMTTDKEITAELFRFFKLLEEKNESNQNKKLSFKTLLVAPFNMTSELNKLINKEILKAAKSEPALIRIKLNNLEDPEFIRQLYKASQCGVTIHLQIRSINCLSSGIPGESENIEVKRLVDRNLEHSRLLIFGTGYKAKVFMGSADMMFRNLHRRIEVDVKVKDPECKRQLIDYFEWQWKDNDKAVILMPEYEQVPFLGKKGVKVNAQQSIYRYLEKITY